MLRKTQGFFEEAQNFAAAAPGAQVDSETGEEERIRLLNRANGIIWKVFLIRIHHCDFWMFVCSKIRPRKQKSLMILESCFRVHSFWLFEKMTKVLSVVKFFGFLSGIFIIIISQYLNYGLSNIDYIVWSIGGYHLRGSIGNRFQNNLFQSSFRYRKILKTLV